MADRQAAEAREVIAQALLGVSYSQALAEWEGGELEGTVSGDAFGSLVALFVRLRELEQERDVWIAREQEVRDGSLADAWRASAFKEHAKRIQVEQERDEAIRLNEYEVLLRERDEAINDALNAEARLREYEEALEAYSAFDDIIGVLADARQVKYARLEAARAVIKDALLLKEQAEQEANDAVRDKVEYELEASRREAERQEQMEARLREAEQELALANETNLHLRAEFERQCDLTEQAEERVKQLEAELKRENVWIA